MASYPTRQHLAIRDLGGFVKKCSSQKIGHDTYDEALSAAERLMEMGKVNKGCHITPYECDECGQWHNCNRVIVPMPKQERGPTAVRR